MNKLLKAVGYCRFSSDKQREESIEAQQEAILNFAKSQNYEIIRWYIDRARSARTDNRQQFQQMIYDSSQKEFRFIIVHKQDRFSRDKYDSAIYKKQLRKNKVKVLSATEPNLSGYAGIMLESVLEANAMGYSINLSNEVRKGMRMNAKKAQNTGKPPFGYKLSIKKNSSGEPILSSRGRVTHDIVIDPVNAEAVKIMFDMTLAGAKIDDIVNTLNTKGYRNSSGGQFVKNSLGHYLRNERYTGTFIYNPSKRYKLEECIEEDDLPEDSEHRIIRVEGGLPQIVSKETFNAVQTILNNRKHKPSNHAKVDYLLTGKIICGECGDYFSGSTHYKNGQPYHYYRCGRGNELCKMISVRKEPLENFVIKEMKNILYSEDIVAEILDRFILFYKRRNNENELIQHLKQEEKQIDKKIQNVVDAIAENGNLGGRLTLKLNALENEKARVLEQLRQESEVNLNAFISKTELRRAYFNALEALQSDNIEDKAAIIDTLLNRVIVYKDRVEVFLNLLPINDMNSDLQITDEDIESCGLLEPTQKEKVAQKSDFPSEKNFGDPIGTRTRVTAVKGRCLRPLDHGAAVLCGFPARLM